MEREADPLSLSETAATGWPGERAREEGRSAACRLYMRAERAQRDSKPSGIRARDKCVPRRETKRVTRRRHSLSRFQDGNGDRKGRGGLCSGPMKPPAERHLLLHSFVFSAASRVITQEEYVSRRTFLGLSKRCRRGYAWSVGRIYFRGRDRSAVFARANRVRWDRARIPCQCSLCEPSRLIFLPAIASRRDARRQKVIANRLMPPEPSSTALAFGGKRDGSLLE